MEMLKWLGIGLALIWVCIGFLIHPIDHEEEDELWSIQYWS